MVLMLPSLTKFGILVDFKLNQDFIAEVLCINKDKPALTCNGKCYISKHLQDVEERERNQAPLGSNEERLEIHYVQALISDLASLIIVGPSSLSQVYYYEGFYHHDFVARVFHPPQFDLV